MENDEVVLTLIRGTIAGLPAEDQKKVTECAEKMRTLVKENGDHGKMALALVGAEGAAGWKRSSSSFTSAMHRST